MDPSLMCRLRSTQGQESKEKEEEEEARGFEERIPTEPPAAVVVQWSRGLCYSRQGTRMPDLISQSLTRMPDLIQRSLTRMPDLICRSHT